LRFTAIEISGVVSELLLGRVGPSRASPLRGSPVSLFDVFQGKRVSYGLRKPYQSQQIKSVEGLISDLAFVAAQWSRDHALLINRITALIH
jgi:hypothetical protein